MGGAPSHTLSVCPSPTGALSPSFLFLSLSLSPSLCLSLSLSPLPLSLSLFSLSLSQSLSLLALHLYQNDWAGLCLRMRVEIRTGRPWQKLCKLPCAVACRCANSCGASQESCNFRDLADMRRPPNIPCPPFDWGFLLLC